MVVRGYDDESAGLLFLTDDRVRDAFTPEEVALLDTVSAQMGVVLANSRVYSRMKERDRLAALGSMAAGLAHEVKNPLGAIKGAAQLLEDVDASAEDEPTAREFVGIIIEEVDRLDRVVGSFLDYARPHAGNPIPLDINAAVRRTVQILSSQIADGAVDIVLDLIEPLPRARIDPEKFRQVLMNLMQNAIQAMDGRGRITVSTSQRPARARISIHDSSSTTVRRAGIGDEERVEVSVRDTGPGISPKVLRNLFVPFFTTKVEGTGLGLAISQSIVQNAGGTIEVHSQPGTGTTFTIVLPYAESTLVTPSPSEAPRGLDRA
jgi:signal transduction histidine kinase